MRDVAEYVGKSYFTLSLLNKMSLFDLVPFVHSTPLKELSMTIYLSQSCTTYTYFII